MITVSQWAYSNLTIDLIKVPCFEYKFLCIQQFS